MWEMITYCLCFEMREVHAKLTMCMHVQARVHACTGVCTYMYLRAFGTTSELRNWERGKDLPVCFYLVVFTLSQAAISFLWIPVVL